MGLFAIPARYVPGYIGTRTAISLCLAAIAVFGLLRAIAPGMPLVLALTVPVGVGMGLAGALLPVMVKEAYAHRPAFATSVYTTGIQIGAVSSAAVAVPLAVAGGRRLSLAVFSLASVAVTAAWVLLAPPAPRTPAAHVPPLPVREPIVWALVGVFALVSITYYGVVAWLPDAYREEGWSEGEAAALLVGFNLVQIPAGFGVGWLSDRVGTRRPFMVGAAVCQVIGLAGFAGAPGGAWLWAVLAGVGAGALFALVLTLPLDVANAPVMVAAVAGVMLGAGYVISAGAPVALGAVRDASDSFETSLWLLAGIAAVLVVACARLRPVVITEPSTHPARQ
jgi:MFS transporter, CP family, cyanate transporter